MPWKSTNKIEQRFDLVRQMLVGKVPVTELSQRFGISRQTAYKWWVRYRKRKLQGLKDQSRRPLQIAGRTKLLWLRRVRRARHKRPTWGARKLRRTLSGRFGRRAAPSTATISRWLKCWGLARGRRPRRRGPVLSRKALHIPKRCHEVWTADFKGWYRTGDGTRVEPLTVRDLYSRYTLQIALLDSTAVEPARRVFRQIFRDHGLPARIRCDNGTPFGGVGPTGLTRLSAWWVRLGIEVEFITPGRPCENGAHEQFHRIYKAEVAQNPERTRQGQQKKSTRWLRDYNQRRPHQSLALKTPAQVFKRSQRRLPKRLRPWKYPRGWERRWVKGNGEISRQGTRRFVGEAFVRDYVGLRPTQAGIWEVYFGPMLVGTLHENETGSIRMAKYARMR
jgi:putative transposase